MTGNGDLPALLRQLDEDAAELLQDAAQPDADEYAIKERISSLGRTSKLYEKQARQVSYIVTRNAATRRRIDETRARMGAGVAATGPEGNRPALTALNAVKALQRALEGRADLSDEVRRELADVVSTLWVFAAEEAVTMAD